jgi:RND family efflux transporter MFP subunit
MNRVTAVLLTLSLAASGPACRKAATTTVSPGVPVRTLKAERRDLENTLVVTGTLRPRAQVQLVAEVSARLMRVLRDEGARVAKDEVLADLDDTDYRLGLDRARAAQAVAEANQAHAVVEKERADNLLKTGGITDKDHLAAQVGLRVAEAALLQTKAEVAIAAQQHARCRIRAPFAGRVAKRFPDPGTLLAPGAPVFTLVDDAVLEFRGSVPSADFGRARPGAAVDITVDAVPGLRARGKIVRVTPLIDERTRAFEIVAEVPGQKDLVGGLFARAAVRVGTISGAIVVTPATLIRDGSQPDRAEVFVVRSGKAERQVVNLGVEQADRIEVVSGLKDGDVVVVDPPNALSSGAAVEIQNGRNGGSR